MKLSALRVQRFQSLWDVEVELGDLTVIVGPSNTGKSAIGRALRTVARNATSSGFVSTGARQATISLRLEDGTAVHVERGPSASTYRLEFPDGRIDTYAKSGKEVPEDVAAVLRMPVPDHGPDPYFSTQFDGPHLLGESGSTSSQALGELTNATTLAEAVREANRRRMEATRTAAVRRADADRGRDELRTGYSGLSERQAALEQAERLHEKIESVRDEADRLRLLASQVEVVASYVEELGEECTDLPDLTTLDDLTRSSNRLRSEARIIFTGRDEIAQCETYISKLSDLIEKGRAAITELLTEAGTCPTCGRAITR